MLFRRSSVRRKILKIVKVVKFFERGLYIDVNRRYVVFIGRLYDLLVNVKVF